MPWKSLLCVFALLLLAPAVQADGQGEALLKEVEMTAVGMRSATMEVAGTLRDQRPGHTPVTDFTAQMRLQKPNRARIDYREQKQGGKRVPHSGVITADGTDLWRYDAQRNLYRRSPVAATGDNILVADALPVDCMAYLFFHGRLPHTEASPRYAGTETWQGVSYRVLEFREDGSASTDPPLIRQRFYIGADHLVHRFVNEQLQGKYVAEGIYTHLRKDVSLPATAFAYTPPLTAKQFLPPPPPMLATGSIAPDLTVEDRDGKPLPLSALRGKVVVLDFWTTTCGHCLESQAHLNAIANKFAGQAAVLALNVGDTREVLAAWLAKHPEYDAIRYALTPSAAERERAMVLYQVPGFPMTYVIDKEGKIVKGFLGYDGPTPDLENTITSAGAHAR